MTRCPNCRNKLNIDSSEFSEKEFRCPNCAAMLRNANREKKAGLMSRIFVGLPMLILMLFDLVVLLILWFNVHPYSPTPLDMNLWISLGIPALVTIPIIVGLFLVATIPQRPKLVVVRLGPARGIRGREEGSHRPYA
jgi:uncharacterized protein (DUF983 family)